MIYTVTFNPALDYVVRMDRFRAGEVNRTASEELQLGGRGSMSPPFCATWALKMWRWVFWPDLPAGPLEDGLQKNGIQTDFIWLDTGLTRINVKIKGGDETRDQRAGPGYRRGSPGGHVPQAGPAGGGGCAGGVRLHPRHSAQRYL